VRKADNLPPSCAVVTKSGNLNFLEPSGPVQACNGTALAFSYWLNVILLLVSGLTIFMAGLGANFEFDLRRIIALSTLRQLGLMIIRF